ncbi:helix-turn-helix transcriptional regulator [Actinacidiphila guanduensis]|uniref:Helix-turn-helix domain-containing protein n=1 Tax=Actinacidiphila guanduensis TaxID=310781 RepID=A0A1H0KC39_9ACTN|nr:helix-turn-helix transcriptional regulator [Actinacidiphila guanduensis]SDO53497.1 Helix-turn-helix domain-containing protein [Actinacidiphila guanduensis]
MYEEWADAGGAVTVWVRKDAGGEYRVLPDGCMDLIWHDGELLVAGPDTAAQVGVDRPGSAYVGLRFAPGAGPRMLGASAREVRDLRVPLEAVWPGRSAALLAERAAEDPVGVLTGWVRERADELGPADPFAPAVAAALGAGRAVRDVAAAGGLGERALHRRCEAAFGYGPKTLARVLRLQRALALARSGRPFAEVAATAGYADQPHLSREVRALTGVTLGALVGQGSQETAA